MTTPSEIDDVRQHGILASRAGFPILLVMGWAWIGASASSYLVPRDIAPWVYVCLGIPAMPIALALERRLRYVPALDPDPLLPLVLQLLFVQILAFPAILLVWEATPHYVPVAFASIVGAHFLPFNWVYRTSLYGILGGVVSVGSFGLAVMVGARALHLTGFFVGATLLVGAFALRAHAKAAWEASRKTPARR
jgi:hypothetical protein